MPARVKSAYLWANGMLMVFDENGQQIPEYQGPVGEVGDKLAAVFPRSQWHHGSWHHHVTDPEGIRSYYAEESTQ